MVALFASVTKKKVSVNKSNPPANEQHAYFIVQSKNASASPPADSFHLKFAFEALFEKLLVRSDQKVLPILKCLAKIP